jgi:ribonuclease HI
MSHRRVEVFCDGGARGTPGPAAAGAVVRDAGGRVLAEKALYLGRTTNNVAEYRGLLLGLHLAQGLGSREVSVKLDSELVVRQLLGQYRVRHPELRKLWEQAVGELRRFEQWEVTHIPRDENQAADELVNIVLDREGSGSDVPTRVAQKSTES